MFPAAARADVVSPATAGPTRVISYNVCGASACQSPLSGPQWTTAMKREITRWDADVVALQELCIGQWVALRDALPGYRAVWTSTIQTHSGCAKWNADSRFGLGVLVKTSGAVDRLVGNLTVPAGSEGRSVLCARGTVDGRVTLACTTHLAQYIQPDNGASQVMAYVGGWAGTAPVIIGADVNADPFTDSVLGPVRRGATGTGPFAEVDENDRDHFTADCLAAGAAQCRSGEGTVAGDRKFDDIFVTAADFHTVRGDAVEPGLSDHRLLRGAAHPEAR
ncbi:endonuclease/exonuclease/phosphatase family protein [Actinoplanes sp. NPDC051859]|uniref:endonuclease/exonuclease/phosphatase family protein n=1 Tax=Actinoplanes sp. NPDC051859 TaxID=3363909 RepID=UPI0037978CF9